ncbi:HDIG domain-containing metalloprotein [Micromonospora sp. NPDC051196]|uniref:HDIG domain-containing metalloprotein n=1 Tax=Micromonospora sp. NPDC051196 TaxID=3155281 RepID=UPI003422A5E3
MTNLEAAPGLAHELLADALPRRWMHVQRVADKASEVSSVLAAPDRPILIAAAWLHDIGYAPGVQSSGLHALDGARWLRQSGWDERVADLVAYHSCAAFEAEERQLDGELRAEFRNEESDVTDALWYADMTTGPDGQDFEIMERLAEIRSRYGPDHVVTRFWSRAQPEIVAAVRRTERRLAARKG